MPKPLSEITPTSIVPTTGRIVLVRYEKTPGVPASVDTIPGIVVRAFPAAGHPLVNVTPFGDGPHNCPIEGAGRTLFSLNLFDPLAPDTTPDVSIPCDGPFAGRRVWCEWMPYQVSAAKKAAG